jgi:tryptophan synthase alpha chain
MAEASGLARIAAAFKVAEDEGRAALMPYLMAGFPDQQTSLAVARSYAEAGADLVEIGVPFSDPLADGPVIHAAATRALQGGATLESSLATIAELGDGVPAVVMCYANMVLALGPERFAGRLADAGAAGAIVPDMPLEEAGEVGEALAARELALVPLVAPTTPAERCRRICDTARGFVYVVSVVGTTGERKALPPALSELLARVKEDAEVPAAVGFGIGDPRQAAEAGRLADGVIIGSKLVRMVGEAPSATAGAEQVAEFLHETRAALASG